MMKITHHTIIENLERFGRDCINLAKQMADHGEPLNREEANLVRQAMLGWVEEIMHEIKIGFVVGRDVPDSSMDRLNELLHAVYDITRS